MTREKTGRQIISGYTELITSVIFGIMVFVFFAFFYKYHLYFVEQLQLFLLTGTYFLDKIVLPGGFNGWIGGFLTQFYYLPVTGALIIAILLVSIQILTKHILQKFIPVRGLLPLSFLPAIFSGFIICSELFPLSAITGFTGSLAAAYIYMRIRNVNYRFITGIILIPVIYYLMGGAFISMVLIMIAFELIRSQHPVQPGKDHNKTKISGTDPRKRLNPWQTVFYILLAVCIPLLVRQFIIFQPVKQTFLSEFYHNIPDKVPSVIIILFVLPFLLIFICSLIPPKYFKNNYSIIAQVIIILAAGFYGSTKWVNFDAEEIMTCDYLVKNQKWDKVISFAERKPPRNYLSLAMLNLSLAKKGLFGEKMFNYGQHGIDGLFLRFDKEFISPMMGNEIFYHLGLINASQEYVFESMEVMPNMEKPVRAIKRLAETNLINGNYKVSEKYIKLLEKTLFYRKWALKTRKILFSEDLINRHPDYGEKRKLMVKEDFFFHVEDIEIILHRLLRNNPENRIAFEYLAGIYLVNRELDKLINILPMMERMNYREMPRGYQEAVFFYMSLTNQNPLSGSRYRISTDVISDMNAYAKIYLATSDARELLSPKYSGTYWYYYHYVE
ncbi:MAG TPA: hypothetical protein DDW27_16605 [Bacteroidales bacterium]|nr:hypothetical protein [Bacteroidales bacterium]